MSVGDGPAGAPRPPVGMASLVGSMVRLARWPNALIAVAGVLLGAWWACPAGWQSPRVAWTMLVAVALTVAINVMNDLQDVGIDRVAHPGRPLASGAVSPRAAIAVLALAGLIAAGAAAAAGGLVLALSGLTLAVGYTYSPWLKARGLLGNVAVAFVASLPFLFGGEAVDAGAATLPLVAVAMPLHFAREIAKDLDDADGDAAGGRRTLVLAWGRTAARVVVLLGVALFAALVTFLFGRGPRLVALLPALAVAAAGALQALRGAQRVPLLLKAAMILAMAALVLAPR